MVQFPTPYNNVLPHNIKLEKMPDSHVKDDICNKIIGSLVGLAVSDALGASVEFRPRQYLAGNPVTKMEGGGTWGLDAGKWTDDTSMALCLASSLITENSFNPYDQMVRYKWWFRHGYLSSTGNCFDIGKATRQSLIDFFTRQKILKIHYRCRNEYEVDTLTLDSVERIESFKINCGDQESAGNGALMRLAPVPLFYFKHPPTAVKYAGLSASLTHANKKAIDGCRYYAALIVGALSGVEKEDLLSNKFYSAYKSWFGDDPLHDDIRTVAEGSFKRKGGYEDGIRGKGYCVNALEAALWAFWSDENSFEKGALAAVNLGDDTDTTAAIYGQLAGAYYGYKKIPKDWLEKLYARDFIISMGEWLHYLGDQYKFEDSEDTSFDGTTKSTYQVNHSEVNESNDKFNTNKVYPNQTSNNEQSKRKTTFQRSISLDSNANTSSNRVGSSKDVPIRISNVKPFQKNNLQDDFTTTSHDYPFYRNSSRYSEHQ